MNLLIISTAELVAVNAIAMQYVRRIDPSNLLAALQIAELLFLLLSTQFAELTVALSFHKL